MGSARWWKDGDPIATAFYNSLSLVFPSGEAFFIESVRKYRDQVAPDLQQQIDAFIKQEAAHSREHSFFNKQVRESGYDTSTMDDDIAKWDREMKDAPPLICLALTAATEHFTAIIAHVILQGDRHIKGTSTETAKLWKWHAIEEVEHKGVAYDTFLAVTKDLSGFQRWKLRSLVMLQLSGEFVAERLRFMKKLLIQDGLKGPVTRLRVLYFLLVYPGIFRQLVPLWLAYFRPSFHPWQHDDRALLAQVEAKLSLRLVGQTGVSNP
jgi:predicted metal-dependent hydrolase